jgi:hypothetical protein
MLRTLLVASLMTACVTDEAVDDGIDDGKSDSAMLGTYYDVRLLSSGKFLADRVNERHTPCADGSNIAGSCFFDLLKWDRSGFDTQQQAKVMELLDANRPVLMRASWSIVDGKEALVPTEVWSGVGVHDDKPFTMLTGKLPLCVAPCEPILERWLNTSDSDHITGLELTPLGLEEAEVDALVSEVFTEGHALIVAGDFYFYEEGPHRLFGRRVVAAYTRL